MAISTTNSISTTNITLVSYITGTIGVTPIASGTNAVNHFRTLIREYPGISPEFSTGLIRLEGICVCPDTGIKVNVAYALQGVLEKDVYNIVNGSAIDGLPLVDDTNSDRLSGGSVLFYKHTEKGALEEVSVLWITPKGRAKVKTGYRNVTSEEITLKGGYSTVANGWADDIICPAGQVIFQTGSGDAHSFSTYRVWDGAASPSKYIEVCKDCLDVVDTWDWDYIESCPNGSDMAIEQAYVRHRSGACKTSPKWDTVDHCPHCGEEVWRGSYEYVTNNPNGSDWAREQAMSEHSKYNCPVLIEQRWKAWRKDAGAKEGETPFFLVKRLRDEDKWVELYSIPCPPDREERYWDEEIERIVEDLRKRS
jgi:hypothetical protein